jgi:hypothetical protein
VVVIRLKIPGEAKSRSDRAAPCLSVSTLRSRPRSDGPSQFASRFHLTESHERVKSQSVADRSRTDSQEK